MGPSHNGPDLGNKSIGSQRSAPRTLPCFASTSETTSAAAMVPNLAKVPSQWKGVKVNVNGSSSPPKATRCLQSESGCSSCWPSLSQMWCGKSSSSCCQGRCVPLDKSSVFFLQALFVWCILCLPGNLVTLALYQRVTDRIALAEANNISDIELIENFIGSSTYESVDIITESEDDMLVHKSQTLHPTSAPWPMIPVSNVNQEVIDSLTSNVSQAIRGRDGNPMTTVTRHHPCSEMKIKVVIDLIRDCFYASCEELPRCAFPNLETIVQGANCAFNVFQCLEERGPSETSFNDTDYPLSAINESNVDLDHDIYQCHEYFDEHRHFMTKAQFWIEGVSLLIVGIFGIAGNIMTVVVLRRIYSNTTFNRLLTSLAVVDTMLLIYYVLDYGIIGVFMRSKGIDEPLWYRMSFPYILHPLKWICMSASIFMVVAISAERHRAICSPLTHRPTFWPYAVIVLCVSSSVNIPRFLEFHLKTIDNKTDYWTTPLNENQDYITFSSWWDELIVTGIIPLSALVLFNSRIYLKLRASDRQEYRFVGRKNPMNTTISNVSHTRHRATSFSLADKPSGQHVVEMHTAKRPYGQRSSPSTDSIGIKRSNKESLRKKEASSCTTVESIPLVKTDASSGPAQSKFKYPAKRSESNPGGSNQLQLPGSACAEGDEEDYANSLPGGHNTAGGPPVRSLPNGDESESNGAMPEAQRRGPRASIPRLSTDSSIVVPDTPILKAAAGGRVPPRSSGGGQLSNSPQGAHYFRKRREKSALILVSIVLIFLFCHTFRLVIQAYEVTHPSHSTAEHHDFCSQRGRFHVPVAFYVMLSASHLLLVVNSSINFLVYCCVGKTFREELKNIIA
eukprot:maker-scaffold360_size197209-snap-gene-0.39 protein:Tk00943 transcript:maker-scaffold360_size197209-snap-gene-0.39-mRNA-1 annotation:"fmrfamide receptor-like isoform x1"